MQPTAHRASVRLAGTEVTFETGCIARQAHGAVLARSGDNVVLATVTAASAPKPGQDFFPLTVEYREKFSAAGRIPGGFGRREGRITDHEVLVSRLIDRTVRSLFPEEFKNEVQVQVQVFSAEPTSDLESLAILAACAALHVSPVPAKGPAGGLRIQRVHGQWLAFAGKSQREAADLEFSVGVGPDGLVMLEGEAKEVPEAEAIAAIATATEWLRRCHKAFDELRAAAGQPKWPVPPAPTLPELPAAVRAALRTALQTPQKAERRAGIAAAEAAWLAGVPAEQQAACRQAFGLAVWTETRELALGAGVRLDGRTTTQIRPIWSEVGLLPRAHGSALFTRGETQAIVTCTLGSPDDAQRIDGIGSNGETERFLLHYNFPPYSVGEIRPLRGPGRREIGHGSLARRGLRCALPTGSAFPYTIRIESEITESNGSSSMATVCGGTMAMLHAGVPLLRPVAGIAMGLISDGSRHAVLSDILGDEDHLGDMDFKVAGTSEGITALQMDNKVAGVNQETLAQALQQAKDARLKILGVMAETIPGPREELSAWAPRITAIKIDPEKIGMVIGKGGETIRGLEADFEVEISIEDDGTVSVYGVQGEKADQCVERIRAMTKDVEVGDVYEGATVVKTTTFGAFVELTKGVDGLLHISNLGSGRVEKVEDVINRGDTVDVRVEEVDRARGRIGLRLLSDDSAPAEGNGGGDGDESTHRRPRRRRKMSTSDVAE